ncbi:MAG TPA: ATP-binding protein, partial [Gemmataceae bacterium]|nr:ATP-binding protein [Gemmataceae bacterium]
MKTLGEAAMDLPWLAPSVASMTALARAELPSVWTDLRTDPGIVLLSAHLDNITSDALLESVLKHQPHFHAGFVDWNEPGPAAIRAACCRYALLASQLAQTLGDNPEHAWIAAFLAPLGWLAAATIEPDRVADAIALLGKNTDNAGWQRKAWGLDHTALARRLSRCWCLPPWLSAILAHLGLNANIAERLGAEPRLVRIVQLAILATQTRGIGLGLVVGADMDELTRELGISSKDFDAAVASVLQAEVPAWTWDEHTEHTLLPELLQLALENRRLKDSASIERLHTEIDLMQDALTRQCAGEKDRLQVAKLSALAEFAAGAGHEINNPLAVISGQAQYVLKQMDWLDVPAEEIEDVGAYLDNIRSKVTPSLNKIIGQTQRIHAILTDLMQFARPAPANAQTLSVQSLIQCAADALQTLAQDRKVRLVCQELGRDEMVRGDVAQVRVALTGLLRNAIEAAPVGGWAGIRYQKRDAETLDLIIEDDGAGPPALLREHMFDPFYSGRNAGRGRGLGLPTAWRLARQQGGDVRFDGHHNGATRFVLTLPL